MDEENGESQPEYLRFIHSISFKRTVDIVEIQAADHWKFSVKANTQVLSRNRKSRNQKYLKKMKSPKNKINIQEKDNHKSETSKKRKR